MRPNLYGDIHKGLRRELTSLLVECGNCDPESEPEIGRVHDRLRLLQALLEDHASHEEASIEPVLKATRPELAAELASEHIALHQELAGLDGVFTGWRRAPVEERVQKAAGAYAAYAAFLVRYLAHMGREENESMPALQAAMNDEELMALATKLRASIPPPRMAQFLGLMLPAMNVVERARLFVGLKAFAPREMMIGVSELASHVLQPEDWSSLKARAQL